jgi:hypothetical protein
MNPAAASVPVAMNSRLVEEWGNAEAYYRGSSARKARADG